MKVSILFDNNMAKVEVTPFERIAEQTKEIFFEILVGERNKSNISSITLPKRYLTHREEILRGLSTPFEAFRRLRQNPFPRMDFYYFTLRDYLKDVDLVYTQEVTRSLYTVASLKQRFNYKIVLRWWENLPYKRLFSGKDAHIGKTSLDKVDLFLPATQVAMKALLLEGVPRNKIHHIYPGVDTDRFSPSETASETRSRLSILPNKIVVLYVGRLVSHKGIYTFPWTAKLLEHESFLDRIVFVIVGDGGERQKLQGMVREMGLEKSFIFTGAIPYGDMPAFYQMSDIFVLPSTLKENIQETCGYVLLEALACGKPVIGSTVGAIPEIIADAGLIVPPGDYRALADAVCTLAENGNMRRELGRVARARAEALFSSKGCSDNMLAVLGRFRTEENKK
jgi:glycosyltransferase involved in cell wall biosynthesis